MKRLLAILLAGLSLFTIGACKEKGVEVGEKVELPVVEKDYVGAEENQTISSTGEYLIKDSKTDYKIVYASDAETAVMTAISELNTFVSEATNGLKFEAVTDDQVSYSNTSKYISIGQNAFWKDANIALAKDLGADGTQMVTKGKSVFLFGNTAQAALYAVYDFLYYILDFDYMYKEVYSLDRNVTEVELKNYDLVNIPDIPVRTAGYGWIESDSTYMNRMRVVGYYDAFAPVNGLMFHNSEKYVESTIADHEAFWRSTCGNQLCYTAKGNAEEYEALQEACLASLKSAVIANPEATVIGMLQEDKASWCSCQACKEIIQEYGATSAILVLFMNDLRSRLDAWFETEEGQPYYNPAMNLVFFSYHKTNSAPATYDEDSETWVANKGIHCNDGVAVMYAPIEADYTHSLLHEKNKFALDVMRGWGAVCDKMYLWVYSAPFANYFVWYNAFNGMQDTYKLAKEVGAQWIFDQAQYSECTVPFGWGALKSYLVCKLAWNVDVDIDKLTDKFFKAAYGPVAEEMKEYYFEQRVYLTWLSDNTAYSCSRSCSNGDIGEAEFWPKPVLTSWLDSINKIVENLEDVKRTDPELYEFYYYNVALERLSIYERLVNLYSYNISDDLLLEYKLQFIADAEALKIGITSETQESLTTIKSAWGMN